MRLKGSIAGQSMVELIAGLMVLIPLLLVLLDLAMIVIGLQVNDNACRDAARAAAAGRPVAYGSDSADSFARAQGIVNRFKSTVGGYMSGPTILGSGSPGDQNTGPQNVTAPSAPYGGQYTGTYRVTTQVTVNVPASIPGLTPQSINLSSRQEFPNTKVEPNTVSPN